MREAHTTVPEIQREADDISGAEEKSEQSQEDAGGDQRLWLTLRGTADKPLSL